MRRRWKTRNYSTRSRTKTRCASCWPIRYRGSRFCKRSSRRRERRALDAALANRHGQRGRRGGHRDRNGDAASGACGDECPDPDGSKSGGTKLKGRTEEKRRGRRPRSRLRRGSRRLAWWHGRLTRGPRRRLCRLKIGRGAHDRYANAPLYTGPLVRYSVLRSGPSGDAVRIEVVSQLAGQFGAVSSRRRGPMAARVSGQRSGASYSSEHQLPSPE